MVPVDFDWVHKSKNEPIRGLFNQLYTSLYSFDFHAAVVGSTSIKMTRVQQGRHRFTRLQNWNRPQKEGSIFWVACTIPFRQCTLLGIADYSCPYTHDLEIGYVSWQRSLTELNLLTTFEENEVLSVLATQRRPVRTLKNVGTSPSPCFHTEAKRNLYRTIWLAGFIALHRL